MGDTKTFYFAGTPCLHTPESLQQHKKYWLLNSDIIIFPPPLKVQKMINLNQY